MRELIAPALLGLALGGAYGADAQTYVPFDPASVPAFTLADPARAPEGTRWDGAYARLSSGFQVSSSKRLGTFAGPTIGFEGGRMVREGDLVYGIVGAFDAMSSFGGYGAPNFGRVAYTRDLAGAIQFKAGTLVADNVLLYAKVGATAVNGTWRFGATPTSTPFDRSEIAVRPDARVGVEWAVTERLTLSVEVGHAGPALR